MNTRTSLLVAVLALFAAVAAAFQPTSPDEGKTSPAGGGSRLGVGFLIGRATEGLIPLLQEGNPNIRVFVQVIPLQATAERREFFTAERMAAYLLAVEDLVDSAKIYGGNAELITEVVARLRGGAKTAEAGAKVGDASPREESRMGPGGRGGSEPRPRAAGRDEEPGLRQSASAKESAAPAKQTVMLEMRDGARLATDWYAPVSFPGNTPTDRVPVVLIRTPYDKGRRNPAMERWRDCLLRNGYAFAVQDMRGFFASRQEGRTGPGQYDGYDTIEWLAGQPWCSGKMGMLGYSHLGAAQYEAAVTAPVHLACAKARYRNTYLKEELLEAGKMYEFDIDLGYIAIAIAPGHRLRLAISSSNFDRWDINPNTGEPYVEHAVSRKLQAERLRVESPRDTARLSESLVATNAIYMDARHPTHVTLPLVAAP